MERDFTNLDLKNLNDEELRELANDIRTFLIDNVSKTGGHLGSNLGVVELSIMLHQVFNSPFDKLIFDVGHQGYVHKILTNRAPYFKTLRQTNGLSGFLKMKESPHDVWEAGHSSTSISAAMGFAYARDLDHQNYEIVCIIGDGSLTNGMSLEALNHLCSLKTKIIIVLNDNEMSISNNVGFIDEILKNIQYSKNYKDTKIYVKNIINAIPYGDNVVAKISQFKASLKNIIIPAQSFFNLMGLDYIGPVDGHNFADLRQALQKAKELDHSVIIHVKTIKGYGYLPAQKQQWHGVEPFDPITGTIIKKQQGISNACFISECLLDLMQKDQDIVVITPAMDSGSCLTKIKQKYPQRFTDVGIAEEHAMTFAAGLALNGKKPFCCIYSTFLQRCYDQINHDVVRQKANVVIGIDRAGIVGCDGETHQGIFDLSFLLPLPNLVIVQGSNENDMAHLLQWAFSYKGPVAIRYARGGNNYLTNISNQSNIVPFKWQVLKKHAQCYIISYGNQINELKNANLDCGLIDACFLKPLDYQLLDSIKNCRLIIVEEHVKYGGLNSYIKDYLPNTNIKTIALTNEFITHGQVNDILSLYNLTGDNLINKIQELLINE